MRSSLNSSFLVFVAVLAAVNVGNFYVVSRAFDNVEERNDSVRHTLEVLNAGESFLRHVVDVETGQRGFLLTGNPAYLQPFTRGKVQALHDLAGLVKLTQGNPSQQRRLQKIQSTVLAKFAEMQETIDLEHLGQHDRALELVKQNTGRRHMLEIRAYVSQFSAHESELLTMREDASARAWRSAVSWYIGTSLLVTLMTLAAFLWLRSRVIRPLHELVDRVAKFGDGTLLPASANVRAVEEVNVLIAAFADMSVSLRDKQKAVQEALQRAEAAWQAMTSVAGDYTDLYNKAPCGYHSLDADGIVRRMNDTELRWLGYAREEVVGKMHITELLAPDSLGTFRSGFAQFLRTGMISDSEVNMMCRDGSTLPVLINATAVRDENGSLVQSRSVVLEHGRLRQERETLRRVLTAAPMAVRVATLKDNRVAFMNRSFCDLVQRGEEEARELDISKNYVDPSVFEDIRARLARGEIVLNRLVELYLPDQPQVPHVWAFGSYMVIEYEGQRAVLAWLYDVTQLHQAKLAAEAADKRAQAESQAKSDFLANMSHEIRSPLNAMLGLAYLLEQTPLQPQQRSQLSKLRVAGQTLLGLINDILDLAKIEAGELSVERAPFSLSKLLDEVYAVHVSGAEAKGLRFDVMNELLDVESREAQRALDVLVGDVQHLRQILLNLINNALKFTERGSVTLTIRPVEQAGGVRLLFQVQDTGIGIDAAVVPMLFNRFTQADSSTTRRFGGTGLGLSIVKQLSEHLGGRVWVESELGKGTSFFVELPFEAASEADRSALGMRATPLEVIIAEDDHMQRQSLVTMARNFGWRVEDVENGAELVQLVKTRVAAGRMPDCLIVDWRMPTLDGLDALRSLSLSLGQQVPTAVVITAHELDELKASAHSELPDSVLLKQVSSSELFNAVNAAVIKRGGRRNLVLEGSLVDRAPVAWLPGVHVLLVDDSDLNLEVAGAILRRQGAVVSTANNGAAALAWLNEPSHQTDIVLMDVQMPVMDGNTAVREIRKFSRFAKLPVVALTAGALLRERTKAMASGMNDFLTKPFDPDNIVRVVRLQVEQARGIPLGTSARVQPGADLHWPEIAGIDGADVRARLSDNVDVFLSGLRRLLQDFGDWQTPPARPDNATERAALSGRMHRLVGNAGVIGAPALNSVAKLIEQKLRANDNTDLERLFAQLGQQLVALARAAAPHLDAADSAKREHEAATREQAHTLDPAALRALREQLLENEFAVLGTFKGLAPALRATLDEATFRRLEKAVGALDFKSALEALDTLEPNPKKRTAL